MSSILLRKVGGNNMNSKQKEQITLLRKEGLGYKRISSELGISVNTVKSFCQRHGILAKSNQDKTQARCPVCDKMLENHQGKKKKRFCSSTFRMTWWNCHQSEVNRKAYTEHICKGCENSFSSYGNNKRKYCSHDCYIKTRFQKERA